MRDAAISGKSVARFYCRLNALLVERRNGMHTLVKLLAWFAARAGANIAPSGVDKSHAFETPGGANRAGQLVPLPEDAADTDPASSLDAHWALWAAVALVVVLLAIGYIRRRWKDGTIVHPAWLRWSSAWSRYTGRE
jgi:hypothetical protein